MNTIKNLALRAAAAAGMLGAFGSNALAQITNLAPRQDIDSVPQFKSTIITIVNSFVGLVAVIAAIMLVYGAYLYVTAGANEDNAKKGKTVVVYAIIGIIVGALVYAIVNVATGLIGGGGS